MPVTNVFSANTPIKAAEVNADFAEVYPSPADWTPTLLKSDGATSLVGSLARARWSQVGKRVSGEISFGSIADPAGGVIYVTPLPVAAKSVALLLIVGSGTYFDTTVTGTGTVGIASGETTRFVIQTAGATAWGGNNQFTMFFSYEVA